jgi:hypothetical protein
MHLWCQHIDLIRAYGLVVNFCNRLPQQQCARLLGVPEADGMVFRTLLVCCDG